MDRDRVVQALQATTSSAQQGEATTFLDQATRIIGFAPLLLQIIIDESTDCSARQAAVIYLKNVINRSWVVEEELKSANTLVMSEQDKYIIREHIIEAIVTSPDAIRVQLCTAVGIIMRHDFPKNWPHLPQKITGLLHSVDGPSWLGALLVLRRLVKIYEYRRVKEKKPLTEMMKVLLPMLYERLLTLMPDTTQESCLLQKIILKIFYGLVQFSLNLEMIDITSMMQWLEQLRIVVHRPVPDEVSTVAEEDRPRTVWWKCKKWASATAQRVFERYGSPGQVESEYTAFAENYMAHLAVPTLQTYLSVLDGYRQGVYVSPRTLHSVLQYLTIAIAQSHTWKVIKPHCQELVRTVLFPLVRHSNEDEELWNESPEEYVRMKYDLYDELYNPAIAAVDVLNGAAKRKGILQPILQFLLEMLNNPEADPVDQDGALRVIGELAPALNRNKLYKKDIEKLLDAVVVPRISHPARFLRARACWVAKEYGDAKFTTTKVLEKIITLLVQRLADANEELPVKVEAAIAIQYLLHGQEKVRPLLLPHVRVVVLEVLRLVAKAEIEEMTAVMDEVMEEFVEHVIPVAVEVTTELANIFIQLASAENQDEDRTVTILGILSTLGSVLEIVEDNKEVMFHVEEQVRRVIKYVLSTYQIDYFEETFALANSLVLSSVSEPMWEIFFDIHKVGIIEGSQFLVDMMPLLHSYLTVDTDSFLARPERIDALIEIAVNVFKNESSEDDMAHAAKLFECLILQCQGRINKLVPYIIQLVLARLQKPIETRDLRVMLIVVIAAGIYYDPLQFVSFASQLQPHGVNTMNYIVNELLNITPKLDGIHDRKMAVIALCTLARLSAEHRPSLIVERANFVNESIVSILDGLQKALKSQAESRLAEGKRQEQEDSKEEEEEREDDLADSEDEIDEGTLEYLETLAKHQRKANRSSGTTESGDSDDSDEGDEDDDDDEEWDDDSLEAYTTPIDEEDGADVFVLYKETLEALQQSDEGLLSAMTSCSDDQKTAALRKMLVVCQQRMNLAKSKQVEQQGGYAFNINAPIPTSFNFGSGSVS